MNTINSLITSTLGSLYNSDYIPEISVAPKPELGEYCINVFPLAKTAGKAPNIISEEVATELAKHTDIFVSTSATGGYVNFFLTDTVWMEILQSTVIARNEAIQVSEKQSTGFLPTQEGQEQKTIIVDYIGANIGKLLHIGHLCTPSIGQVICNVYRYLGYNVIGDVHTGDWGGIFGKLIFHEKLGKIKIRNNEGTEVNSNTSIFRDSADISHYIEIWDYLEGAEMPKPDGEVWAAFERFKKDNYQELGYLRWLNDGYIITTYLCENYVKADKKYREEFKVLSEGNSINMNLWENMTIKSLLSVQEVLDLLHVNPTIAIGESFYEGLALKKIGKYPDLKFTMKDIVKELIKSGIAKENKDDGSVGIIFESWERNEEIFDEKSWEKVLKLPSNMLQKRDGTHGYFASDLACIKYRTTNDWNPIKIIYCTDIRQELHFKQVFTVAKMAGWLDSEIELIHAPNGFIRLTDGAMSSRTGKIISLKELIDQGFIRTKAILEEKGRHLSERDIQEIAIGAIKYSYLMQDRERDITFDWDKALAFEGNSGPYIQYAYVRASVIARRYDEAIQEKNKDSSSGLDRFVPRDDESLKLSPHDKSLIQSLAGFRDAINTTAKTYKPHHIALYAYSLAVTFNGFYVHTPKILEEKNTELRDFRLALVHETTETLKKSFELLGIEMPSEM